ncbi:MAG: hypothetical protein ACI4PS_06225 [Rhodocyclaceae bacterium]
MSSTGDTRWDTLNSGDKLTGDGAGSVLNIITVDKAQGAGGQSDTTNILPTITNVETLNAQVYHDLTINSQFITGMKNVNLQALQDGELSMIGVNSKLENINLSNLENNDNKPNNVEFSVNADQLSATDDVLNVSLNNVVQGKTAISTINVNSTSDLGTYETLNIASNGAKTNQIFLNSNSANIGISGGAVEIDASAANLLATVDATASAGNVKLYNVDANGVDANGLTSVKLGGGDDIISINNFNAKTTIDTGAGADLVAIKNTTDITAEKLNNISNAETIRLSGEDATIDFNKLTNGVKNFEVASDYPVTSPATLDSFTFNNVAAGSTFKVITNDSLGFPSAADRYASTVQALKLNGTKGAATSVTLTNNDANVSLTNNNFPTLRELTTDSNDLSLVSTGKYANTIGYTDPTTAAKTTLTAGSGSATASATVAIKISGDQDLTVTNNLVGNENVKNFNVDASELTGNLTIEGYDAKGSGDLAHSDVIIGGSGGDRIATGDQYHGTVATQAVAARLVFNNVSYATDAGSQITLKLGGVDYIVSGNGTDGNTAGTTTAAQLLDVLKKAVKYGTTESITTKYAISLDPTNTTNGKLIFTQVSGQEGSIDLTQANNTFTATSGTTLTTTMLSNTSGENIQGSAAVDAIKGSYNVLTGNDGADLFAFNQFKDGGVTTQKLVTAEITDFKSGEYKIVFNNTGFIDPTTIPPVDVDPTTTPTVDAANFKKGDVYQSMDELFAAAIKVFKDDANIVAPATAPANKIQYFVGQVGNDTYLFNDGGNVSANVLGEFRDVVKLTGVDLADIQASDIYDV